MIREKFKTGFTTAELMIALLIMGVIVASVVPVVTSKIQSEQYKVAWKKIYSELSQATDKIMADNAGSLKGVFTNKTVLRDKYAQYIGCIKKCSNGQSEDCWHRAGNWYYQDGSVDTDVYDNSYHSACIIKNGMLLMFGFWSAACTDTSWSNTIPICGDIYIDVNGFKGPNTYGKDLFFLWITEDAIKPYGVQGDGCETDCGIGAPQGTGCSAQYLYQ